MEITISQNKLIKALNVVSKVAGVGINSTTLPILNNILIRAKNNQVVLIATNLEMAVTEYITVSELIEGEMTIPAKLLTEFIGHLPRDTEVKLVKKDNKVVIKAGKYSSILNSMSAEDFPELPEINEENSVIFRVNASELKDVISSVIIACSNNTTRPVLTGVYFNTYNGSLYLSATDGYRLAEKRFINNVQSEVKAIIPATSLQEVLRVLNEEVDEVEILFDEMQVRFRIGDIEITSKLIDGSYLEYRGLIPKETKIQAIIPRDEMQRAVKLAASFARSSGGSINCESRADENILSVSAVANEFGENNTEIEVEVQDNARVTFNSKFLLDVLNVMNSEKIMFGFSEKITPLLVKENGNEDFVYIIMPQHE